MKAILTVILSFAVNFVLFADDSVPKNTVQVGFQYSEINNSPLLAINFKNYPEWHTYWKNPGDAGLALDIKFFSNNKEIKLESAEWPIPKKFIEPGDQWAFGYVNEYSLFYPLTKEFQNKYYGKKLNLKIKWLVCKNICVPGMLDVNFVVSKNNLKIDNQILMSDLDPQTLQGRFINLPKIKDIPNYLDIKLTKGSEEKSLVLSYEVKNITDTTYIKNNNLMFLFPQLPFDFKHEQISVSKTSIKGILPISWDGEYSTPPEPLSKDGKFKKAYKLRFLFNDPVSRESYVIEKKFDKFDTDVTVVPTSSAASNDSNLDQKKNLESKNNEKQDSSLIYYLAFSFLGGLILNVMPCVLPVISLKLFGLIKYQKESRARILKHNLFYTLGVLATFILLASTILILKNVGTNVGWGFQLQSPNFIAVMVIALFIFSLNLFGLFEFVTPGGSKLGNVQIGDNFFGDFLGGVLAVILSTPCSAPFLGTALTFAFSSSGLVIVLVFMMIGLGLAFPFILTGFFPSLVSFLPKPGNWMNTLKKLLGVTLILTIFWLVDVYNTLVNGQNHLIKLFTVLLLIFVAFLLHKKEKWITRISFLLSLLLFINLANSEIIFDQNANSSLIKDKQAKGLDWQPWSKEAMEEHRMNRNIVFMDFTAKWCFTCKVNEKVVLETDDFKNLVKEKNLKLLIADWTKRDEVIGNFLMQNKLAGVPAYFIQKEDGTLISLGETISIEKIRSKL